VCDLGKRDQLPKICQFNAELHFKEENYGHKLADFMEILRGFMAEAHYVLMDIDTYDYLPFDSKYFNVIQRIN
jgi:hypothetical protein